MKLHMGVYLLAKFEVSSIILTGFRQGGGLFYPSPSPPQNEPIKSPTRLGLKIVISINMQTHPFAVTSLPSFVFKVTSDKLTIPNFWY